MSEAIHPHNLRKEIGFIDGLTGLQKHLLHELLAHCDAEEFSLPPKAAKRESDFWSVRRLGELVSKCARHTRRALRRLVDLGFVERDFRDWSPSRFQLFPNVIGEAIQEALARRAAAEEERRQAWKSAITRATPPAKRERPPPPTPMIWEAPPVIGQVVDSAAYPQGGRAYPHLVAWALRQAEHALEKIDAKRKIDPARFPWAAKRELALAALGAAAMRHRGSDPEHIVFRAAALVRPLSVIHREAGEPGAEGFLFLIALAFWSQEAGVLGDSRGGRGGFWTKHPTVEQLFSTRTWRKVVERSIEAWEVASMRMDEATAALGQLAEVPKGSDDWLCGWAALFDVGSLDTKRALFRIARSVEALHELRERWRSTLYPNAPPGEPDPPPDE